MEIWTSLPTIFVIILVVNIFEPSVPILLLVMASFIWVSSQYCIRGECLRLKNRDFAHRATSFGATKWQVFTQHIVPNAITPIVTLGPFTKNQAILFLSFLEFMGLGVQAPTASLGELLAQGRTNFFNAWWLALYPFLDLVFLLLLLNFIGEGVRKAWTQEPPDSSESLAKPFRSIASVTAFLLAKNGQGLVLTGSNL